MSDTAALQTIAQQLAAIEMPPPPDWQPWLIAAAIAALVIAAIPAIHYWHRQQHHGANPAGSAALTELKRVQQQWQQGMLDDRRAAYRLCTILRLGLQLEQLTDVPPPPLRDDTERWQHTLTQLKQLRYAPPTGARLDKQLFRQAEHWLSRKATPC